MAVNVWDFIHNYEAAPHQLDSARYGQEETASFFGTTATIRGNQTLGYMQEHLRTEPVAPVNDFGGLLAYYRQKAGFQASGEPTINGTPDANGDIQPSAAGWSGTAKDIGSAVINPFGFWDELFGYATGDEKQSLLSVINDYIMRYFAIGAGLMLLAIGLYALMPKGAREVVNAGIATAVPGGGAIGEAAKLANK